jgi:hypothetical protein
LYVFLPSLGLRKIELLRVWNFKCCHYVLIKSTFC